MIPFTATFDEQSLDGEGVTVELARGWMASGKTLRPSRNDALAVMTKMFGAEPGWENGVA